ncbi:MAG: AroM family protein [bacterium]|nr:AroM family protein [candidate division KSB1 bacterium]MDH7561300.1 AroM family protein [bacterium]
MDTIRIGAITIGQSPRPDIFGELLTPELQAVEFVEAGALDQLAPQHIAALAPRPGEPALVTRLRDGSAVRVSTAGIAPLLDDCVRRVEQAGVAASVLLCTADFELLRSERTLFRPAQLLRAAASALLTRGTLAVVVPEESQVADASQGWHGPGRQLVVATLPPYDPSPAQLCCLVEQLRRDDLALVVLNCMGYGRATQQQLARALHVPVLSPRLVLAAVLSAFVAAFAPQSG